MATTAKHGEDIRPVATNRKARFDYFIEEEHEAGLVLLGSEVKSLRQGRASLVEAWIQLKGGEAWLLGVNIPPYAWANRQNHEPLRPRKLLMKSRELEKLGAKVARQGFTLVPLQLYFKGSRVKLALGVCKGKKQHDKRHTIRDRDAKRDAARALRRGER